MCDLYPAERMSRVVPVCDRTRASGRAGANYAGRSSLLARLDWSAGPDLCSPRVPGGSLRPPNRTHRPTCIRLACWQRSRDGWAGVNRRAAANASRGASQFGPGVLRVRVRVSQLLDPPL